MLNSLIHTVYSSVCLFTPITQNHHQVLTKNAVVKQKEPSHTYRSTNVISICISLSLSLSLSVHVCFTSSLAEAPGGGGGGGGGGGETPLSIEPHHQKPIQRH